MMSRKYKINHISSSLIVAIGVLLSAMSSASAQVGQCARTCERAIEASVVAINHDCRDNSQKLYHTDNTALITDLKARMPPLNKYGPGFIEKRAAHGRLQPFRKITVHYHKSQDRVQPFPRFYDPAMGFTLNTGADGFAINYGVAGIDSDILTNRLRVGLMWDCAEYKFEDLFLCFRAAGDPAMPVDVLANSPCTTARLKKQLLNKQPAGDSLHSPKPSLKATRSFFPNDLSNVYHSYMTDVVEFRILHRGVSVHHVRPRHTHQWSHSPNNDDGHYPDSQFIGPSASFSPDIVYKGSGNRNLTVGDSVLHCHFYPHFAAGMWALHRVRDVFEAGTPMDDTGRPSPGARATLNGDSLPGSLVPAIAPLSNSRQRAARKRGHDIGRYWITAKTNLREF